MDQFPKNLFSAYLSHGKETIPPLLKANIETFKACYPSFTHTCLELESADAFIENNLDRETLESFRTLKPLAYKTDLLRYCLMYVSGGIYSDISVVHSYPLSLPYQYKRALFAQFSHHSLMNICTAYLVAQKNDKLFETCIHMINKNVSKRFYGNSSLAPTGPEIVGQAYAKYRDDRTIYSGNFRTFADKSNASVFMDRDAKVLALYNKPDVGLSRFGAPHDSYNDWYNRRQIYGESLATSFTAQTLFDRGWVCEGALENGLFFAKDVEHRLLHGPYLKLQAGKYRVEYNFDALLTKGKLRFVVTSNGGQTFHNDRTFEKVDDTTKNAAYEFELEEDTDGIEFIIYAKSATEFKFKSYTLTEL